MMATPIERYDNHSGLAAWLESKSEEDLSVENTLVIWTFLSRNHWTSQGGGKWKHQTHGEHPMMGAARIQARANVKKFKDQQLKQTVSKYEQGNNSH
jgi:hypothetical protein